MTSRACRRLAAASLLLPLTVAGCDQAGAALGVISYALPKTVDAAYKGLAGQQTVVMVWTDKAVRLDHPELRGEVAAAVQDKLINAQLADKPDALKGMTFPFSTTTVEKHQDDSPEWEDLPAEQVAAKLYASRLIYVEVTDFQTRSAASLELFRGSMTARLRVVEMTDDGHGKIDTKVGYDGGDISVVFPKDSPKDGLPNRRESQIAQGTIDRFADLVAQRFYKHDEERN